VSILEPEKNFNLIATDENGVDIHVYGSQLFNKNLNNFKDWQCAAGSTRIFILPDTSVYGGEYENDFLGKLEDNSFELLTTHTVCKKDFCYNNPDDLMIEKFQLLDKNNK